MNHSTSMLNQVHHSIFFVYNLQSDTDKFINIKVLKAYVDQNETP